jgi:hypothetical protein
MLDFSLLRNKEKTLDELCVGLTRDDLYALTEESIAAIEAFIAEAVDADVTFLPIDSDAHDEYAAQAGDVDLAWTLGHVIVHITASSEEAAAQSATLARGVDVLGRSRYEVPWQSVTTIAQLRHRLQESRRMRQAFLDAWPDEPHLEKTYTADHPKAHPRNAITYFVGGLAHENGHLEQIAEIHRQARLARPSILQQG